VNLNKSLADELNQPKNFPTARSNKKSEKPNKAQNPIKPKTPGFSEPYTVLKKMFTKVENWTATDSSLKCIRMHQKSHIKVAECTGGNTLEPPT